MINITDKHNRALWQAEVERMSSTLEYSQIKDWTRLLNSQFIKAAKLVRIGRQDDIDFIIDDDRPRMLGMLKNHYRRVATVFSNKAFGIFASKKFIQPTEIKTPKEDFWKELNAWMGTQAGSKITKVAKTTKKTIADVIHKGMQEQLSHVDIAKNIRSTGFIANPHRARTIALTETHTAAVKSMDSAVKSTRIEMEREWVSAKDDRTRRPDKYNIFNHFGDFPNGANGERVPEGKDFVGTGEPMSYPGDPKGSAGNIINCRCVLLYHTVNQMEKIDSYEPEIETLGEITVGKPAKSAKELFSQFDKAKSFTVVKGKMARGLKAGIEERLGERLFIFKSEEMDNFIRPLSNRTATLDMNLEDYKIATKRTIQQWAGTSGDKNSSSIMMQLAAKAEFKLEGSTIWWKDERSLKEARELFKAHEKSARKFLRLMYEDTQEYFKKQGVKTVRLARGLQKVGELKSTVEKPFYKMQVKLQPMSSFSGNIEKVYAFATNDESIKRGTMLFAEVPVERILSTPVTGYGCMNESEFVILGATKKGKESVLAATITLKQFHHDFWDLFHVSIEKNERELSEGIVQGLFEELKP